MEWETLGLDPSLLAEARLALHWAAQLPSAAGNTLVPKREDASHAALAWDHARRALVGEDVNGTRAALFLERFTIGVIRTNDTPELPLAGMTMARALEWLARQMHRPRLERPTHELPDHPVQHGHAFGTPDERHLRELARWYANAARVLAPHGTVRCWPHHFDIAALDVIDADAPKEKARSIGVGMSPGDGSYAEPYFYVTPWPYPSSGVTLPAIGPAQWHVVGWIGAVLRAKKLLAVRVHQGEAVQGFFDLAIGACKALLGA